MDSFLFMHLIFLGFWGGLVLVEMILEFSLKKDLVQKHLMAQLHYRIDLYAEVPILIAVLVSGMLLLNFDRFSSSIYTAKVITGLCPVVINILCVIPVVCRKRASDRGDIASMQFHTKMIFLAFFTGFATALVALSLGMRMLGIF